MNFSGHEFNTVRVAFADKKTWNSGLVRIIIGISPHFLRYWSLLSLPFVSRMLCHCGCWNYRSNSQTLKVKCLIVLRFPRSKVMKSKRKTMNRQGGFLQSNRWKQNAIDKELQIECPFLFQVYEQHRNLKM